MTKIEKIEVTNYDGQVSEHVIIRHNENEFTSMPKAVYEAQQAEQSTPNLS